MTRVSIITGYPRRLGIHGPSYFSFALAEFLVIRDEKIT